MNLDTGRDNKILDNKFCFFGFRMFGKELTMFGIVLHFLTGLICIMYRQDMKPFQNSVGFHQLWFSGLAMPNEFSVGFTLYMV